MLIEAALIVAFVSWLTEMIIARKLPLYRRAASANDIVGIVMSLALSAVIGATFGAGGMIIMLGGLISTLASLATYKAWGWWDTSGSAGWNKFCTTMRDFFHLMHKILRVVTFPIWGWRALKAKMA